LINCTPHVKVASKETTQHFLACPHPDQEQLWKDLHHSILKLSVQNSISSTIYYLLENRLCQGGRLHLCSVKSQHFQQYKSWLMHGHRWYGNKCTTASILHNGLRCVIDYFAKIITLTWQAALTIYTTSTSTHPIPWRLTAHNYKQQYNRSSTMCKTNHNYKRHFNTQPQNKS